MRVRIGEMEVEMGGNRDEVISTLDELNGILDKVSLAFNIENRDRGEIPIQMKEQPTVAMFPRIARTTQCGEAVVSLLSTDWGKNPRTISELREAMEANAVFFPKTTLSGVLVWLVKKGEIRRWKDKKRGYLYVLNEVGG